MTNDNMNTQTSSQQALLTHKAIELLMIQAQVFASAWSLIGSQFDKGNALADAEAEKKNLHDMLKEIFEVQNDAIDAYMGSTQQLATWFAEIANARIKSQDVLPIVDRLIQKHVKVMPETNANIH